MKRFSYQGLSIRAKLFLLLIGTLLMAVFTILSKDVIHENARIFFVTAGGVLLILQVVFVCAEMIGDCIDQRIDEYLQKHKETLNMKGRKYNN